MRLGTLETSEGTTIVALVDVDGKSRHVDLRAGDSTLAPSLKALLARDDWHDKATRALQRGLEQKSYAEGRLLAPIPLPGKVICIGLNYRDHAAESGLAIPEEPVCFGKFSQAVIGPDAAIVLPKVSEKVDYEAELVVVIGKPGRNIPIEHALQHVAGYTVGHDVSARDWQVGRPGGQWLLGKTPDTFAPLGPYLVTADDIDDPHQLRIQLRLNGETMQDSNTKELIFRIEELIAHISPLMTLQPGDIIFTGTPPGVGMARKPPVFLKPGDEVEVEIEGLGVLRNPVKAQS